MIDWRLVCHSVLVVPAVEQEKNHEPHCTHYLVPPEWEVSYCCHLFLASHVIVKKQKYRRQGVGGSTIETQIIVDFCGDVR
jgi:hypothetical protein